MYTLLIVDDAKDAILLLQFDLNNAGYNVLCAENGAQALELLNENNIDMVLLDIHMPEMSGLEVLKSIKTTEKTKNIPVIMLSASDDEDEIVASLALGAVDHVTKPYISKVLLARINTAFRLVEKTAELEKLAQKDFLTGINNRRNFYTLANQLIEISKRHHNDLAIAMYDLDDFKNINDQYGHDIGDQVLKEVSQLMIENFRECDIVARIGGEEFAACLPQTSLEQAQVACERFRKTVEYHRFALTKTNKPINITMSIGVAAFNQEDNTINKLLSQADHALYQAKHQGKNRVVILENAEQNKAQQLIENAEQSDEQANDKSKYAGIDKNIGINNVLGDEALFEQVLAMFYEDHAQDEHKLKSAFAKQDIKTAKHLAHTLKGVASSIGAMALFNAAKALDIAINQQDEQQYLPLTEQLGQQLSLVTESIKALNPNLV